MAYSAFYCDFFTKLGYPCNSHDGAYQFTGDTPSQSIIDAVEAFPSSSPDAWNVDLASDEIATALRALVSGAAWTAFSEWHEDQWLLACQDITDAGSGKIRRCMGLYNSGGFAACRDYEKALLTAAGMTRQPY